jgi:hypothetical protein
MKSPTPRRALALVYIALTLAAMLWFVYLNPMPHSPPSPPALRNPIHDARPVPTPVPTSPPHRDRVIYEA